jgi:hypothetical protein
MKIKKKWYVVFLSYYFINPILEKIYILVDLIDKILEKIYSILIWIIKIISIFFYLCKMRIYEKRKFKIL